MRHRPGERARRERHAVQVDHQGPAGVLLLQGLPGGSARPPRADADRTGETDGAGEDGGIQEMMPASEARALSSPHNWQSPLVVSAVNPLSGAAGARLVVLARVSAALPAGKPAAGAIAQASPAGRDSGPTAVPP